MDSQQSISTSSVGSHTYVPSSPSFRGRSDSTNAPTEILDDDNALNPDPGKEAEFDVKDNPFAFSPGQLSKLLNPKSFAAFHAVRGLGGLEKGLRTSVRGGLSVDEDKLSGNVSFDDVTGHSLASNPPKDPYVTRTVTSETKKSDTSLKFSDRRRVYGDNRIPDRKPKSFWHLAWIAAQDKVLIILSIAAVISLALGLYQTFSSQHEEGARVDWVEGVAIMVAIIIVIFVGALNDWQKERQFAKLNKKKEDREVKVIRSGKTREISVHDVLVGDVMILEQGDVIPADGIFISGHNVSCDESSATGESDLLRKTPAIEVFRAQEAHEDTRRMDPFILSGAKVSEGVGSFLVTATGVHSTYGKTMMSLREDNQVTPLQLKLNTLASYIAKVGLGCGLLLFVVLMIEFFARLKDDHNTPQQKGQQVLRIFIVAVSLVVVAVPEGLPLAVTLALAFATKKMTKDNNLVRHLQSCETMGDATVICSDKTGTLTENLMTVVGGNIASSLSFSDQAMSTRLQELAKETLEILENQTATSSPTDTNFGNSPNAVVEDQIATQPRIPISELSSNLSTDVRTLLRLSVAINSTAFEGEEDGKPAFIGSKTEVALLDWAKKYLGLDDLSIERSNNEVIQLFPFDSKVKCMGAIIQTDKKKYRLLLKGAPEIVLDHCTRVLESGNSMGTIDIDYTNNAKIKREISTYACLSLRTIALAYRDFEEWPPRSCRRRPDDPHMAEFDDVFNNLRWIGVLGIQDPVRKSVPQAVEDCKRAGVNVKMVTGDNIETATAIAKECGILQMGGLVMEGQAFRSLNDFARQDVVRDLSVLARSSPEDKKILVKTLRHLGNTVAVTGDGTNDAPALKAADVGFSMGIAGTEVAKEASDIILMDDNFSSIVKALAWGRTVNDAVKKFLQFQLTVNIVAVLLTFFSAVTSSDETSVLNAVQLLWVNLIMDTMAALALATDPPSPSVLDRKPEPRNHSLITVPMWKMIIGQALLQSIVTFILYFAGPKFLHYPTDQHDTLVFNTFVWMQIFNALNCRRIDNRANIFEGMWKNWLFMAIFATMICGQILIVFVGGEAFVVTPLTGHQWAISIVIGLFSLLFGLLIRAIPDSAIEAVWKKVVPKRFRGGRAKPSLPTEVQMLWSSRLGEIRDDLAFFRRVHGGRLAHLKYDLKHPKQFLERSRSSRSGSRSPMHSAIAMSGSIAGSIGVSSDMSPMERRHSGVSGLSGFETGTSRTRAETV